MENVAIAAEKEDSLSLLKATESSSTSSTGFPKSPLVEFESFSWAEEKEKVKIYVDMQDAGTLGDENIVFNWTEDSLCLQVFKDNKTHVFEIDALFDKVSNIQLKKKSNKFILTLIKAREIIWYKLRF